MEKAISTSLRSLCCLVGALFLWCSPAAQAQRPRPATAPVTAPATAPASAAAPWVHESWTVRDGLPVNSIRALIQDRAGYIWAATFDGLARFDGARFTVYNSANSDELPSNRITSVVEARDGALWLTTEQGHVVRFQDGTFRNIAFEGETLSPGESNLTRDSSGALWVGNEAGLWTVRRDRSGDERLVRVGGEMLDRRVISLLPRKDGTLWVGTIGAGVFRVAADGSVAHLTGVPALDADEITRMTEDRSGTVWLAGLRALWKWRDGEAPVRVRGVALLFFADLLVPMSTMLAADSRGGLYRIDDDSARLVETLRTVGQRIWAEGDTLWTVQGTSVRRGGQRVITLPEGRIVTGVLFDREGSLWLGTDAGGLHRLKRALFTTLSVPEGVGHPNVYSTFVDRAGAVWLGTWGNGASRIDPVSGGVSVPDMGPRLSYINSFFEDRAGALWIGAGQYAGVSRCTLPAMTCEADGPPELRNRSVFALHGDADGRLWVGADGMLVRRDSGGWTTFSATSGAPTVAVRAFANTRDGAVWMGTNGGGLVRYKDGVFTRVTRDDGLPSDLVRSLHEDADGWLWAGTEGRGLARLDPRAYGTRTAATRPAIVRVGTKDGLFDEVIHQMLEDDYGRMWMNTNRGVFWVARAELNAFADGRTARVHSTAYSERDGIRNREGNGGVQPAGARGLDGRLWFPTQDGVVVVDPARLGRDRRPPSLVIEGAIAAGQSLLPARDSLTLGEDERDVQFEYTALTFLEPSNVRFRYRLDPYDADWVDAGNRRTAFYTKVPPGRYTFQVQATDPAGEWHEPGRRLAVHVAPRFRETGLFLWASVLTFGALVVVALRLRDTRLRKRALHLERVVDERTVELRARERELADHNARLQSVDDAKTRFFANVSHELRTPLTLTIGPLEDLRARAGGDPQVERWLDIALRNARRLLRLVNQILDVSKLEAGAMQLAPRPLDLGAFTRGIAAAFGPVAERNGIGLTVETPEGLRGAFDADAIEKIITNLLSNAIKFTPAGGAVRVALTGEPAGERAGDRAWARLVVTDTGPGIPPDHIPHVFERFYQVDESTSRAQPGTGIGLALAKELVELHGGTISVTSGHGGTVFAAVLPVVDVATGDATAGDVMIAEAAVRTLVSTPAAEHVVSPAAGNPADAAGVSADDTDTSIGEDIPTLLVVDDSADLRAYIRDHFTRRFRVLEAGDGGEGIALARQHLPDVVLSDVMMPGTDGFELVRVLRESVETDFLSIILLTAQAGDDQRLRGLERGADDYLVKPFDMRELDARVRNVIASRRRLRDRFTRPSAEVIRPDPAARPATKAPVGAGAGVASGVASGVAAGAADQAYMARVRETIARGLSDPAFGVGELADAVSQDRSHLFRRVKLLFGESPSDLIRRMRVEEGERLLADPSATVTDVAYAAGFNSLSYFCRCFQEVYGETPAVYRSRMYATPLA
ncbi:MAG: two-component regulator propeller domain-containing protein [Gemmatimonadota bacterium]